MADFTNLSYVFHTIREVSSLIIHWLIVGVIRRSPWKQHLRWAFPTALATSLLYCSRLSGDLHHYLRLGTYVQAAIIGQALWYVGDVVGIYGLWMLWRTIKDSMQSAAGKDLFTQALGEPDPGVWPPPPRRQS